jgi:hypothetical protein
MKPIPILAGTVALLVCVIAGDYLSHDFEPASVEELQAAMREAKAHRCESHVTRDFSAGHWIGSSAVRED